MVGSDFPVLPLLSQGGGVRNLCPLLSVIYDYMAWLPYYLLV